MQKIMIVLALIAALLSGCQAPQPPEWSSPAIVEYSDAEVDWFYRAQAAGASSYSVSGGADAQQFRISQGSGDLRFFEAPNVAQPGDADGDGIYEVTLVAHGEGGATALELQVHLLPSGAGRPRLVFPVPASNLLGKKGDIATLVDAAPSFKGQSLRSVEANGVAMQLIRRNGDSYWYSDMPFYAASNALTITAIYDHTRTQTRVTVANRPTDSDQPVNLPFESLSGHQLSQNGERLYAIFDRYITELNLITGQKRQLGDGSTVSNRVLFGYVEDTEELYVLDMMERLPFPWPPLAADELPPAQLHRLDLANGVRDVIRDDITVPPYLLYNFGDFDAERLLFHIEDWAAASLPLATNTSEFVQKQFFYQMDATSGLVEEDEANRANGVHFNVDYASGLRLQTTPDGVLALTQFAAGGAPQPLPVEGQVLASLGAASLNDQLYTALYRLTPEGLQQQLVAVNTRNLTVEVVRDLVAPTTVFDNLELVMDISLDAQSQLLYVSSMTLSVGDEEVVVGDQLVAYSLRTGDRTWLINDRRTMRGLGVQAIIDEFIGRLAGNE